MAPPDLHFYLMLIFNNSECISRLARLDRRPMEQACLSRHESRQFAWRDSGQCGTMSHHISTRPRACPMNRTSAHGMTQRGQILEISFDLVHFLIFLEKGQNTKKILLQIRSLSPPPLSQMERRHLFSKIRHRHHQMLSGRALSRSSQSDIATFLALLFRTIPSNSW
jgi:hypothetical protein